uniref:Uncharacterized protein n=1 Tax=Avena sativa TaxID=4498 RepID=A0ACD5X7W3_AVESA
MDGAMSMRKSHQDDEVGSNKHSFKSVALVVGATGMVGSSLVDILPRPDTPGGPWKVYALSRRSPPPWSPAPSSSVTRVLVDLTDTAAVAKALAPLADITHVFYVTWSPRATEADNRETNSAMLRNVLSAVGPNLAHVCLQTGTKHYIGPFDAVGEVTAPEQPYTEDAPRRSCPNFYYDQEDILFDEVSRRRLGGADVSWSVHRPSIINGVSPRSFVNNISNLCVYAAICRKERATLRWPGSRSFWDGFCTASDADLIAEQQVWAAVDPVAKNQAFNCSNGDVFRWRQLWPVLAAHFGLEWTGYNGEENRFKLSEAMAGKEAVWAEIVEENGLVEPRLFELANWDLFDLVFGSDWLLLDSMNKSKEHGFLGFRNTLKSFDTWISKMKAYKIVP